MESIVCSLLWQGFFFGIQAQSFHRWYFLLQITEISSRRAALPPMNAMAGA
jgi:hypothetical protein